jgi:hypothetical protein
MKINTKKGFALLVSIIIIAVFSLGGATAYLIQKNKNTSSVELIAQEKSNDSEISTTTSDTDIDFASELEQLRKELEEERGKRKELEGKVVQNTQKTPEIIVQNTQSSSGISQDLLKKIMARIVPVKCLGSKGVFNGSGTTQLVENDDMIVVTNFHVVNVGSITNSVCTINIPKPPDYTKGALYTAQRGKFSPYYPDVDVALLHISKSEAKESGLFGPFPLSGCSASQVNIGDKMIVLGYPAFGENTLTVTDGTISGILPTQYGPRYKTSAKMDHGVSGGLAISTEYSCIIGIPTWGQYNYNILQNYGIYGVGEVLGQIQSWESIVNHGEIF